MMKKIKKLSKRIHWSLKWFLTWRLALFLIVFLAVKLISYKSGYLGGEESYYLNNPLSWGWANFDGVHYLLIAKGGYTQYKEAFFPLFPFLVRFLANFVRGRSYLFFGLLVSHLAFGGALVLFYKLLRLDLKTKLAKRTLFYLLIFPTSFYFVSVYTESLFLFLLLASFYAARKRTWLWAGFFGGLASATRFVGIFLLPALLVEWWQSRKNNESKLTDFLSLFLVAVGLLVYMFFLQKRTGDPFYFIHLQGILETGRTGGKIILLYQVFWRYFKMLLTTKFDVLYFSVWLEFLVSLLFLGLSIWSYFHLRLSYFVFMILAFLTPTLTGTFSSMPRYVLVLFPGFMALAILTEKHQWLKKVYPVFAIILGIISLMLFVRGYWVA